MRKLGSHKTSTLLWFTLTLLFSWPSYGQAECSCVWCRQWAHAGLFLGEGPLLFCWRRRIFGRLSYMKMKAFCTPGVIALSDYALGVGAFWWVHHRCLGDDCGASLPPMKSQLRDTMDFVRVITLTGFLCSSCVVISNLQKNILRQTCVWVIIIIVKVTSE